MRSYLVSTFTLVAALCGGAHAQSYEIVDLGTLPAGNRSWAFAINEFGQVTGTSMISDGRESHAFLWEAGQLIDLGDLNHGYCGSFSFGNGLNDLGTVTGTALDCGPYGTSRRPVVHNGIRFIDLGFGYSRNYCRDIDNSGRVVGAMGVGQVVVDRFFVHAFLWENGSATDLGTLGGNFSEALSINNSGQIVGGAHTKGNRKYHAFLFEAGSMVDLGTLGGRNSEAQDVNELGQVVGWSEDSSRARRAFLYKDGAMQDLGTLGGKTAEAFAVNVHGMVVGQSRGAAGRRRAFLYDSSSSTLFKLEDLLTTNGFKPQVARDINDLGQIVGWGRNAAGEIHAFVASPVIE